MAQSIFYTAGTTEAVRVAAGLLKASGIIFADHPGPEVTDLLLDVPSFSSPGILRNGEAFSALMEKLPGLLRIFGGKLSPGHNAIQMIDLLEDPAYLAENAFITADCAVRLCGLSLKSTWADSKILVIGWGRIGKQLCRMLKALGAMVTVCARKEPDRALLNAFGYNAIAPEQLNGEGFDVIFNTAPNLRLEEAALSDCPIPMDLASQEGLTGKDVIYARGLPGIYAPLSSGKRIAAAIELLIRR